MDEKVVLINDNYVAIDTMLKSEVHTDRTPLHKAFSCYIFNENKQLLITKRSASKQVWPGVWTGSVCGHPFPGETFKASIIRRSAFELGATIKNIKLIKNDYRYKTPPFKGIIENEWCPIYYAQIAGAMMPNPDEVSNYRWVDTCNIADMIASNEDLYSYWFKDQQKHIDYGALRYN